MNKFDFRSLHLNLSGLKMRLIMFVGAMLVVIISVIAVINYISLSSAITDTVNAMIGPLSTESASDVSSKILMLKSQSETVLLRTISSNGIGVAGSTKAYLNQQVRDTGIGAKSFVIFKANEYYTSSYNISEEEIQALQSQDVYTTALSTNKVTISDPEVTADGTSAEFMIIVPGKLNITNYILVLKFDVSALSNIVGSVQFGETGRAYLINKDGRTIADPDLENVINGYNASALAETDNKYKEIAEAHALALSGESGQMVGKVEGVDCQISYAPVKDSEWAVILVAPESEFKSPLSSSLKIIIMLSIIMLLIAFLLTFIIMSGIVNPIVGVTKRLKALSDGDLTSEVEVIRQKSEIGELSALLNETVSSLRMYIDRISKALKIISEGNMAFEMDGYFRGDFNEIKDSFNTILDDLRKTFEQINLAANQVSDGANQVAAGAQLLSSGAVQQSEAVSGVSQHIDNIVMHAESNSAAAIDTKHLVDNIEEQIASCNNEMSKMLVSMDDITKSSAQISEIIKVIDDIAFQTNILALNAAVEAARAGDAGLGFAVVADEVRNLANMSADAAKQTSELIEDSIRNVKHGTVIARATAESLKEIVNSAAEINEQVQKISDASQQQNDVIITIRDDMQRVSEVIDNTSSTAEQSAATAQEMSGQAAMLREMIAKFKYRFNGATLTDVIDGSYEEISDAHDSYVFDYESEPGGLEVSESEQDTSTETQEYTSEETNEYISEEINEYGFDEIEISSEDMPSDEEFTPIDFNDISDDEFKPQDSDKY